MAVTNLFKIKKIKARYFNSAQFYGILGLIVLVGIMLLTVAMGDLDSARIFFGASIVRALTIRSFY